MVNKNKTRHVKFQHRHQKATKLLTSKLLTFCIISILLRKLLWTLSLWDKFASVVDHQRTSGNKEGVVIL
jgi:hypothetical protein